MPRMPTSLAFFDAPFVFVDATVCLLFTESAFGALRGRGHGLKCGAKSRGVQFILFITYDCIQIVSCNFVIQRFIGLSSVALGVIFNIHIEYNIPRQSVLLAKLQDDSVRGTCTDNLFDTVSMAYIVCHARS